MNTASRVLVFDCDGVLTDPKEKRITQENLPIVLAQRIDLGDIVSINTGRSIKWLIDEDVIGQIERHVKDKSKLSDIIAVGEKGGSWLTYDKKWETHVDKTIKIPKSLQTRIHELIENDFSESMFYDESKLTMISTEMKDGYEISQYTKSQQNKLIPMMKEIIAGDEYKDLGLTIDPTIIATDIQNKHVGKHLGAKRILEWLKIKQITPRHFITVGDSQSDTEMAEELQDEYSVEFVFVGNSNLLDRSKLHCPVIVTKERFEKGTLEYLKSL